MNEEQHIIQFEHTFGLYNRLCIDNDFYINSYRISKNIQDFININVLYLNLDAYSFIPSNYYYYIFNLSNMLYKIHNPNYYRKYNHKELI